MCGKTQALTDLGVPSRHFPWGSEINYEMASAEYPMLGLRLNRSS